MSLNQSVSVSPDESVDEILRGKLRIIQSKKGYRFSIDAILLAEFALRHAKGLLVDLGTGCGIVALSLLAMGANAHIIGIEIQKELAHQAMRNSILNRLQERFSVIHGDIRYIPLKRGCIDMVLSNPPFRRPRSCLMSPDMSKAVAKNQILMSLDDLIEGARYLLKSKGRLCLVYPAEQATVLIQGLRRKGLEPKRVSFQHPTPDSRAELLLLEAQMGARPGLIIEPPIFGQGSHSNICQVQA
ncbi:MAG: tRNA1(Val) (adenine(37)-N6)-methyltransferase [Desulfatiglandales bacterium]